MDTKFHPAMAAIKAGNLDELKSLVKGPDPGHGSFINESSHLAPVFGARCCRCAEQGRDD